MDPIPENEPHPPIYDKEIQEIEEEVPQQQQPPSALDEETRLRLEELLARTAAEESSASSSRAPMEIEEHERPQAPPSPPTDLHIPVLDDLRLRITARIGSSCGGVVKVYSAMQEVQDSRAQDEVVPRKDLPQALMYTPSDRARQLLEQRINRAVGVPAHANVLYIEHYVKTPEGSGYAILPLMELGSIRAIVLAKFPNGMPEECIVVVLKEVLGGLKRIHLYGRVHTEVSLGYIFLSKKPEIKLGFASGVYDHGVDPEQSSPFIEWAAAPEIYNAMSDMEYTQQADLWMVGVAALEMAFGGFRVPGRASLETFLDHIRREKKLPEKRERERVTSSSRQMPPCFNVPFVEQLMRPRAFSRKFEKMVMKCLQVRPGKRPKDVATLLKMKVFTKCKKDVHDFYMLVNNTPDAVRPKIEDGGH